MRVGDLVGREGGMGGGGGGLGEPGRITCKRVKTDSRQSLSGPRCWDNLYVPKQSARHGGACYQISASVCKYRPLSSKHYDCYNPYIMFAAVVVQLA